MDCIEAVTKHPVINTDGSNTMLKVTTRGNRTIVATKAKSFLQLRDELSKVLMEVILKSVIIYLLI